MPVTHRDAPEYEYQPFGAQWARRLAGSAADWEMVEESAVPEAVRIEHSAIARRGAGVVGKGFDGSTRTRRTR